MLHVRQFGEYDRPKTGNTLPKNSLDQEYLNFLSKEIPDIHSPGFYALTSFDNYELYNFNPGVSKVSQQISPNIWNVMIDKSLPSIEQKVSLIKSNISQKETVLPGDEFDRIYQLFISINPFNIEFDNLPENCLFRGQLDGTSFVLDFPYDNDIRRVYWSGSTPVIYESAVDEVLEKCAILLRKLQNLFLNID